MELIRKDLRELDLRTSDLSDIFLRLANPDGLKDTKRDIAEQYLDLLNRCAPDECRAIRSLVSEVVVFGAMRGLQWGDALRCRHSRRKHGEDGNEWSLLRHQRIVDLLRKSPPATAKEICEALDKRGEPLPWGTLPRKGPDGKETQNPFWEPNAKHQSVRSLITRARKKLAEMDADRVYLMSLNNNRKQFSEEVHAIKKAGKPKASAAETEYLPGLK